MADEMKPNIFVARLHISYRLRDTACSDDAGAVLHDVPGGEIEELVDASENGTEERAERLDASIGSGGIDLGHGAARVRRFIG